MDWQIYKKRYHLFIASLGASGILTSVSSFIFKDFPDNLPPNIRKTVGFGLEQVISAAKSAGVLNKSQVETFDKHSGKFEDSETISIYSEIIGPFLFLKASEFAMKKRFNWERLAISQQLIMIFTFFDAFFSDSIRSICEIKPEFLRRDKKISWRKVLELGDFDILLHHLIETYVFKLGWNDIEERLKTLEKEINLKLDIIEDDIKFLHYAEQIRNILVHSGGRVTPEFLRRAGSFAKGSKIGDYVNIDSNFLRKLYSLITNIGGELYLKVSTKFFCISESEARNFFVTSKQNPNIY